LQLNHVNREESKLSITLGFALPKNRHI
jgi:hypothetical protein